jgi:RNA polymerase sigma-70 factor, ECF subfamily
MDRSMALAASESDMPERLQPVPISLTVESIYDAHFDFVWRSLRRLGVPSIRMDDAAQDVFVVVHRRLAEFAHRSSVKTWLFGIVLRVAHDHRRSQMRKDKALRNDPGKDPDGLPDESSAGPLQQAQTADSIRLLQQLVNQLSEEKREIFLLSELEQMTAPEISEALGIQVTTVQSRLRAARSEFDAALSRLRGQDCGGFHGNE